MLEQILSKEKIDSLKRHSILEEIERIISYDDSLIKIDSEDIKYVLNGEIYAYANGLFDEHFKLNIVNENIVPTKGIIFFKHDEDMTLTFTSEIIEKIKSDIGANVDYIYGCKIININIPEVFVLICS